MVHLVARSFAVGLLLASSTFAFAQPAERFPNTLDFRSRGVVAGKLHFHPAVLAKHALTAQDLAATAGSILTFHADAWKFDGPLFWDLYVTDAYPNQAGNLGNTLVSPTQKVAGATTPGPTACVSVVALDNIAAVLTTWSMHSANDLRARTRLDFTMTHEAAHCFQRIISKAQNETVAYSHADWFSEGSATWLAGDYLESTGREYPGYWEVSLRDHHQRSLLLLGNANHFFFKWLSGPQGLKSRAAVISFVKNMLEVPQANCVTPLDLTRFPGTPGPPIQVKDCAGTPSPYPAALKQWFAGRNTHIADVLTLFGSAIVRGSVPGIRAPNLFLKTLTHKVGADYNKARAAVLATGVPVPLPLGKIAPFTTSADSKLGRPEAFGFEVFEVRLSQPLLPTPHGYHLAAEDTGPDVRLRLSSPKSDDVLNRDGWIRIRFFEGLWLSVARADPEQGQKTRILMRVMP